MPRIVSAFPTFQNLNPLPSKLFALRNMKSKFVTCDVSQYFKSALNLKASISVKLHPTGPALTKRSKSNAFAMLVISLVIQKGIVPYPLVVANEVQRPSFASSFKHLQTESKKTSFEGMIVLTAA